MTPSWIPSVKGYSSGTSRAINLEISENIAINLFRKLATKTFYM